MGSVHPKQHLCHVPTCPIKIFPQDAHNINLIILKALVTVQCNINLHDARLHYCTIIAFIHLENFSSSQTETSDQVLPNF